MSEFKGDNGKYLTQGLFYEWNNPDAPFSMRDSGEEEYYVAGSGKKYRSFPHLFRKSANEYDCAIRVLGSWEHWKRLTACNWFLNGGVNNNTYTGLNDWRMEKELADEAAAKRLLLEAVENGDVSAAKFLYDKKTKTKAGRPETKKPTPKQGSVVSIAKGIKSGS